jgi:hypothetical protein
METMPIISEKTFLELSREKLFARHSDSYLLAP